MKYPEYYDAILGRHEPRISDYALEKVAYKEAVFQIWCGHKERIRDIIIAKQKRKGAKALTKTLLAIRPILEKKERESEVKKAMKLEAEIK